MAYDVTEIVLFLTFGMLQLNRISGNYDPPLEPAINSGEMSAEKRLIGRLLSNYEVVGKNGRPVLNISKPVPVKFGLGLIQMDLDEKNKMLAMSTWTRYTWTDEYLMWNPTEFENMTSIRLSPDLLWIPDIMLYNTVYSRNVYSSEMSALVHNMPLVSGTVKDADLDLASRHALAVVDFTGRVSWYPHTLFRSSCSLDVTKFPFDEQTCELWFGSWTYSSAELSLDMAFPGGIDLSTFQQDYKESCPWSILNLTDQKRFLPNEESSPNFIVLTFEISMSRKMVFSSYILTLPCIFLACLTLVVFWLPPERPDRTSLAMSIFASFMVLLLILVEAAPPTASSVPSIGVYYCFNMVIIMLSVILSSLVVNISRGSFSGHRAPAWMLTSIGKWLATLLLLRRHAPPQISSLREDMGIEKYESHMMLECARDANCQASLDASCQNGGALGAGYDNVFSTLTMQVQNMGHQIRDLKRSFNRLELRLESGGDISTERFVIFQEWRYLALVLDRFFFLLYLILIIVSLSALFPRPHFKPFSEL